MAVAVAAVVIMVVVAVMVVAIVALGVVVVSACVVVMAVVVPRVSQVGLHLLSVGNVKGEVRQGKARRKGKDREGGGDQMNKHTYPTHNSLYSV